MYRKSPDTKIKVYRGKYKYAPLPPNARYYPMNTLTKVYDSKKRTQKVVVLDLDETIGNFVDLFSIWNTIFTKDVCDKVSKIEIQSIFNELLDLYPEFLRYGILHILDFIRNKIQNGESHRIFLYTNNQCFTTTSHKCENPFQSPTEWVEMIIVYLNLKLGVSETIFAKPICAFKINDRRIEPLRESANKTHSEFLKCSILPKNVEICFVDDNYHSKMCEDKVYYIQPPPYFHNVSRKEIIDRFIQSKLHARFATLDFRPDYTPSLGIMSGRVDFNPQTSIYGKTRRFMPPGINPLVQTLNTTATSRQEEIYQKLLYYIKEFFVMTARQSKTRRRRARIGKFSRRVSRFSGSAP